MAAVRSGHKAGAATVAALLLVGAALLVALSAGLGAQTGTSAQLASQAEQDQTPRVMKGKWADLPWADHREVVCWGDSLTEGVGADVAIVQTGDTQYDASFKSYPQILRDLCGLTVINCGVSGATSEEIVAMREGIPADSDGLDYEVFDQEVADLGAEHPGDILVVEIGSNGGWDSDYELLISQYWRIIEYSDCDGYIVVGDTDDPGTSWGDMRQQAFSPGDKSRETSWEQALQEEFGDHFINMRLYLIENGLKVCGLEEEPSDDDAASQGCISDKLKSDWTHLDSYGYYAKARGIYERGLALGYWLDGYSQTSLRDSLFPVGEKGSAPSDPPSHKLARAWMLE